MVTPSSPRGSSPRARSASAGASAQAQYRAAWTEGRTRRLVQQAVLAVVVFAAATWLWGWWVGLILTALVAGVDALHRWRSHAAVRTWRKGAAGERRTARMLRPLARRGYTVLHDRALPYGRANVDHLVIGPTGIFVVDTKNWDKRKRVTRRGRRGQYVRVGRTSGDKVVGSVIYEAERVSETLARTLRRPVEVVPVVAIHGASVPILRVMRVSGVPLLRASQVPAWISRQGGRLSAAEVTALSTTAERLFPPYVE